MQLRKLAGRLSNVQLASYSRSLRWAAAAVGVCVLILGIVVLLQPADEENFAVDEFDFREFDAVTIGEPPVVAASDPFANAEFAAAAEPPGSGAGDSTPNAVTLIPTAVPQPDRGVRTLASGPALLPEKPAVWLTGSIEE